jgi:hypothetical protein
MSKLISAVKWAFGKDGTTVTQYVMIYMLFYYQAELETLGVPAWLIPIIITVILNLNNNALKSEIIKTLEKNKKLDGLVQLMKHGFKYEEAEKAIDNPTIHTQITKFPPVMPLPDLK